MFFYQVELPYYLTISIISTNNDCLLCVESENQACWKNKFDENEPQYSLELVISLLPVDLFRSRNEQANAKYNRFHI